MLERQRMVYGAIVHLIKGAAAPVHGCGTEEIGSAGNSG